MKDLEIHESEEESILILNAHFEKSVRHAILALPIKDLKSMIRILSDYDIDDKRDKKFAQNRSWQDRQNQPETQKQKENFSRPREVNAIASEDKGKHNGGKNNKKPFNRQNNKIHGELVGKRIENDIDCLNINIAELALASTSESGNV